MVFMLPFNHCSAVYKGRIYMFYAPRYEYTWVYKIISDHRHLAQGDLFEWVIIQVMY